MSFVFSGYSRDSAVLIVKGTFHTNRIAPPLFVWLTSLLCVDIKCCCCQNYLWDPKDLNYWAVCFFYVTFYRMVSHYLLNQLYSVAITVNEPWILKKYTKPNGKPGKLVLKNVNYVRSIKFKHSHSSPDSIVRIIYGIQETLSASDSLKTLF